MDPPSRGAESSSERCLTAGDALLPKVRFTVGAARHPPQRIPRFLVLLHRPSEPRGIHRHLLRHPLPRCPREPDRDRTRGARALRGSQGGR